MDGNQQVMVGNLTRPVEIEYVTSKKTGEQIPKGKFSLARSWGTGDDSRAEFFDFEVWREQALNLAQSTDTGTRLIVVCIARQDRWVDKETGGNRSKVRFEVVDVGPALRFATAQVSKNARPDAPVPVAVGVETTEDGTEVEFGEEPF